MKVTADLTIIPMGVGPSVSDYIADIKEVMDASDVKTHMQANGTALEGELSDIIKLIEQCEQRLSEKGVERIHANLSFSSRRDKDQSLEDKLKSVRTA